ncbi:MAG: DUF222 domain-containing protein, partial [bacterium]|nr:DUF222 domain-containing protein [bacterium]
MSDNNIQKSQSAKKAHQKLVTLLEKIRKYEHSALLVFSEIMHRKLYEELGYSSMLNYAKDALGMSRTKAFYYISITKSLENLPKTKTAVEKGEIEWTKVREVTKVATADTEDQWLAEAKKSSRRDFVKKTKQARQFALEKSKHQPSLIESPQVIHAEPKISKSFSFPIEQMERFNVLLEKLRKIGETGTNEELLIKALELMTVEKSTRVDSSPSTQIVIKHCPECGKAET